jgi:hypothetical protein
MAVPNTMGAGVGLMDKGALDANFTTIINGGGMSTLNGVTARAGGTQVASTPVMSAAINRVTVCATGGDSVLLPSAIAGQSISVINSGVASMNVFSSLSSVSDTINGTVGSTAFAIAAGKTAEFICPVLGAWFVVLSA